MRADGPSFFDLALDAAYIDRKIRYLTLASLAGKHIGGELSYSDIASTLEIEISSVEAWIIDGMLTTLNRRI